MKTKSFLLILAMLGVVFYSCVEDKEYSYKGSESIVFDAYVAQAENTPQPMAFESSWENNDAIGIFMTSGAGLTTIVDGDENKKFATPDGDGQFWNIDADNAIHYPKDGSKVNFIAYYPYSTALVNNVYKVDVKDQASQAAIDLMYSDNAKDYSSASAGKPQLEFIHQLTKVVFNIEGVGGISSLEGLKIEIENMAGTADFDLATKTLTAGALDSKIAVKTTIDAANPLKALSEGIVIPTAAAARKFIFTLKVDGQLKSFEWDASAQPFEAGKKNTYPVKLDAKLGALVQPGATIKPWEDGSSEDIEIDLSGGTEQLGEGTEASPYTIAGATANVGQNEKWITGYIVGSTTKTRAVGTPSKDNILLAPTAGETDESKCIVVDLVGSAVQANLDIVTYPELIGASVKVKGNIVNDLFGGALSLTAVTAQVGGKEITPGGEEVEFFNETFGERYEKPKEGWLKIAQFTYWDMKDVTYSDQYGNADIRNTSTMDNALWLPANKDAELHITGFETGYKGVKLSFDVAAQVAGTNVSLIQIFANGQPLATQPDFLFEKTNTYTTLTLDIPDGTTSITFYGAATVNTKAFRFDNIILKGTK